MKKMESQIARLTEAVEKLVNHPVAPIAPVASVAPILPIVPQYSGDHDLIVGLVKDVGALQVTVNKLADREDMHVTKSEFNERAVTTDKIHVDHETRIRSIETSVTRILIWGSTILGLLTIAQIVLKIVGK